MVKPILRTMLISALLVGCKTQDTSNTKDVLVEGDEQLLLTADGTHSFFIFECGQGMSAEACKEKPKQTLSKLDISQLMDYPKIVLPPGFSLKTAKDHKDEKERILTVLQELANNPKLDRLSPDDRFFSPFGGLYDLFSPRAVEQVQIAEYYKPGPNLKCENSFYRDQIYYTCTYNGLKPARQCTASIIKHDDRILTRFGVFTKTVNNGTFTLTTLHYNEEYVIRESSEIAKAIKLFMEGRCVDQEISDSFVVQEIESDSDVVGLDPKKCKMKKRKESKGLLSSQLYCQSPGDGLVTVCESRGSYRGGDKGEFLGERRLMQQYDPSEVKKTVQVKGVSAAQFELYAGKWISSNCPEFVIK